MRRCGNRHRDFWVIGEFLWCPDCGALRKIRLVDNLIWEFFWKRWLYPAGQETSLKKWEILRKEGER